MTLYSNLGILLLDWAWRPAVFTIAMGKIHVVDTLEMRRTIPCLPEKPKKTGFQDAI
jgi:hypothetical protein